MSALNDGSIPLNVEELLSAMSVNTGLFAQVMMKEAFFTEYNLINHACCTLLDSPSKKKGIKAPRSCGKTTCTHSKILKSICYGQHPFILYFSSSGGSAMQQTENIKSWLETDLFVELFGKPKVTKLKEAQDTFGKEAYVAYGNTLIVPRGTGQQVRGMLWNRIRPTLYLFDDTEDRINTATEEARIKLLRWFFGDVLNCVSRYDLNSAEMIVIGTLLGADTLLDVLSKDPAWDFMNIAACDEHFNPTEPSYMTKADCINEYNQCLRRHIPEVFAQEFLNRTDVFVRSTFKQEDFTYFDLLPARNERRVCFYTPEYAKHRRLFGDWNTENIFTEEKYYRIDSLDNYKIFVIVDPAKTTNKRSADSGIVVFGVNLNHNKICIFTAQALHIEPSKVIAQTMLLCSLFDADALYVETTSLNQYVSEPFKQALARQGLSTTFNELQAKNKDERILSNAAWYGDQTIVHQYGQCNALEQQLLDYPNSKKKDVMDAAGYITEILNEEKILFTQEAPSPKNTRYTRQETFSLDEVMFI